MAVNWTREQKQVIEGREKSLLVSAAAGSGKTAVLVERIIQMITEGENPKDIDRLLVMTFTRAAAAEMRERSRRRLRKNWNRSRKMNISSSRQFWFSLPRSRRSTASACISCGNILTGWTSIRHSGLAMRAKCF